MMKRTITILALLLAALPLLAQRYEITGRVIEKGSGKPVEFATIVILETERWAVTAADGTFALRNLPPGNGTIEISCLGYVTHREKIAVSGNRKDVVFSLAEDNLTLAEVVVTAQDVSSSAATSRHIDKAALEQMQVMNVSDITSLLPGGATAIKSTLTDEQRIAIRSEASEAGNASFGTAIEVDGVRLSSNSAFNDLATGSSLKGVTTNNIASSNVESVEVISGIASVEYGDMTSGVVRIHTKKGVTPWSVTMSTSPSNKQLSLSKGFSLGTGRSGASLGVLNASAEYTRSVADRLSPYSAYDRKQLTLNWSNSLEKGIISGTPLRITAGITGNLGGRNTSADPDAYKDTWTILRDNTVRGNLKFDWLLSKSWITNFELSASISYSDKFQRENTDYSSAGSKAVLHGREEGYFVARTYEEDPSAAVLLIPRGYWYNEMRLDDRPMNYRIGMKANWARNFGTVNNKVKAGADFTGDKNFGIGEHTADISTAPEFREYRYCDQPWMYNAAVYLEDNLMIPVGKGRINLIAGLRSDNTYIKGSAYGLTSSLSPRANFKYSLFPPGEGGQLLRDLSFKGGWGRSVKLPSASVLYPQPGYLDIRTYAAPTASDGSSYQTWYIHPYTTEYNAALKWQYNDQAEIGVDADLAGNKISLTAFRSETRHSYEMTREYEAMTYHYIQTSAPCAIPADNRAYAVDRATGTVTVSDKSGVLPSEVLSGVNFSRFIPVSFADNAPSPVIRYGLEWVVDFKKIESLNTKFRIDGTWYSYRWLDCDYAAYYPSNFSSYQGISGTPYKYVGWYYGGNSNANGQEQRTLRTNLTVTTNVPSVRMVLSLKVEGSLLRYSRSLSEYEDGSQRSWINPGRTDILDIIPGSIYDSEDYVVLYPEYYTSVDDPTPRDFLADLKQAKESGNNALYGDLTRLVQQTSYTYTFKKNYISPYFCLNLSVTKEIGDAASVSFYANNFINSMGQVKSSQTGNYSPLTRYIPDFYYGLTLRLKL